MDGAGRADGHVVADEIDAQQQRGRLALVLEPRLQRLVEGRRLLPHTLSKVTLRATLSGVSHGFIPQCHKGPTACIPQSAPEARGNGAGAKDGPSPRRFRVSGLDKSQVEALNP